MMLNPNDYDREADYVAAVFQSIDPRPLSANRLSRWALRRVYPEIGLLLATIAVDAAAEWRYEQAHRRGHTNHE